MFTKETVEAVIQDLEKYAQSSELTELENLAKIAVYQDSLKHKNASKTEKVAASTHSKLSELLAASVTLGK